MRVLALTNLYPPDVLGGYELACSQVVDALRARGHDVRVLAARPRVELTNDPEHIHRRFDFVDEWSPSAIGRHILSVKLRIAQSRVVNAFNVHVLSEAIDEFAPEVIYVNNIVGVGGLALLATLNYLKVPWVWQLGDYIPKELCSDLDGLIPGLARVFAHEVSGTYSIVSSRVLDESRSDGLGLNGRIELIPNWITGVRPAPRARFYSPGQPLKILAVGRVDAQKGVDLLIDAAAKLHGNGIQGFTIDIYGRIVDPAFPRMIRSFGLGGMVRFQGPRAHDQILELYSEYDLLLFPTHAREPFGLVPLEAMARGCVPVISAHCGVGEWLVHGVDCLKAPRTSDAFARVLHQVIHGELELEPLARRGESVAWNSFHVDSVLPRIEALLLDTARKSTNDQNAGSRRPARAAEAYRLARMAEQLTEAMIQEACLD